MVTFFIFVKTNFPEPINCLNGQSGLVMTKIYQTEANKPLIYSNHTGVRARTPCISFTFFICVKQQLSCTYQLSKLSKWTCYDQNIPNRRQQTINLFKLYSRTSSYAVHFCPKKWRTSSYAHTFLLHFKFVKTDFLCLQATLSVVLTCFYPKHGSQKPMNP